jgi:hypothetical protein
MTMTKTRNVRLYVRGYHLKVLQRLRQQFGLEIETSTSQKSNEHWTDSKKFDIDIISKASVHEARSDILNSLQRKD